MQKGLPRGQNYFMLMECVKHRLNTFLIRASTSILIRQSLRLGTLGAWPDPTTLTITVPPPTRQLRRLLQLTAASDIQEGKEVGIGVG